MSISSFAVDDRSRMEKGSYMILKATVNSINTRILLDNGSQADLVNEPFARANKLDTFPLTKRIRMTLRDGSFSQ